MSTLNVNIYETAKAVVIELFQVTRLEDLCEFVPTAPPSPNAAPVA